MTTNIRGWLVMVALVTVTAAGACTPTASTPVGHLDITTIQTICGGAVPPDGQPACRSNPASRAIEVGLKADVVASGTSDANGKLLLTVPPGTFTVSDPDALPYMNCDSPSVDVAAGQTVEVTQTCTLLAP